MRGVYCSNMIPFDVTTEEHRIENVNLYCELESSHVVHVKHAVKRYDRIHVRCQDHWGAVQFLAPSFKISHWIQSSFISADRLQGVLKSEVVLSKGKENECFRVDFFYFEDLHVR